jgi:hypothetical protein
MMMPHAQSTLSLCQSWGYTRNPSLTCFHVKQAVRSRCVSRAILILPLVLWRNQQTIAYLVLRPKPRNHRGDFVGQITKPQLLVLRPKQRNPSEWFWGQIIRIVAIGFEAKQGETVDPGFEAKPWNSCSSSPCLRCRPHTTSPNLSIIRQLSTRPALDHRWSSAPSLLLLCWPSLPPVMLHLSPTHQETSTCISPHETDSRVGPPKFPEFKFKPRQVNYSS